MRRLCKPNMQCTRRTRSLKALCCDQPSLEFLQLTQKFVPLLTNFGGSDQLILKCVYHLLIFFLATQQVLILLIKRCDGLKFLVVCIAQTHHKLAQFIGTAGESIQDLETLVRQGVVEVVWISNVMVNLTPPFFKDSSNLDFCEKRSAPDRLGYRVVYRAIPMIMNFNRKPLSFV